jgi:hypothetical protein
VRLTKLVLENLDGLIVSLDRLRRLVREQSLPADALAEALVRLRDARADLWADLRWLLERAEERPGCPNTGGHE